MRNLATSAIDGILLGWRLIRGSCSCGHKIWCPITNGHCAHCADNRTRCHPCNKIRHFVRVYGVYGGGPGRFLA